MGIHSTAAINPGRFLAGALLGLAILAAACLAPAHAADLLIGVADETVSIDPAITPETFYESFADAGPDAPSVNIGANGWATVGVMLSAERYDQSPRPVRVVVDSDGDGVIEPMNWYDPIHPWMPPDNGTPDDYSDDPLSWEYVYPDDYPVADLRGKILTVTYDPETYSVGFPWEDFEWLWYQSKYDDTQEYTVSRGELIQVVWFPRDDDWKVRPNGNYLVAAQVDENEDRYFTADEPSRRVRIGLLTGAIIGRVVDREGRPIAGASVEVTALFSLGMTFSDERGRFALYGLDPGESYQVIIRAPEKVMQEKQVVIPEDAYETDMGVIVLRDAVAIRGVVKLDRDGNGVGGEEADRFAPYVDQWGWEEDTLDVDIQAQNTSGPGRGLGGAGFNTGDLSVAFAIDIPVSRGNYILTVSAEGYAEREVIVAVSETGGDAGEIVLTKASRLSGWVRLPAAVREWKSIDVQAVSTTNPDARYWGWGSIDPFLVPGGCSDPAYTDWENCEDSGATWTFDSWLTEPNPTDTGDFQIDGIPAGTYRIEIRVMGYRLLVIPDVVVAGGQDKDMGTLDMALGGVISGTLLIEGDTTNLKTYETDTGVGDLTIWLNTWSTRLDWSGTEVTLPRGVNQSVPFTISGLENGIHEIYGTLGEGYELVDESGASPILVNLRERATRNLIFKPFMGRITGAITGNGVDVDLSRVAVEVKRPWDWLPPRMATVANGGIGPATGQYQVGGLGTGDYVVVAGMYRNLAQLDGTAPPEAESTVGVTLNRVSVKNDAASSTRLDIGFGPGYFISGCISLNAADPPWHDFGDGSGGAPNGVQDPVDGAYDERISISADLAGQFVTAIPVDLKLMGDLTGEESPRVGRIIDNGDGTGCFRIEGLSPGAYAVTVPFNSQRVLDLRPPVDIWDEASYLSDGEIEHHWTTRSRHVVIDDENVTDLEFKLANGYTVSGRVILPEALAVTDAQWDQWEWIAYIDLETSENLQLGYGKSLFKRDFENGTTYPFTFRHVDNGDYQIYFWTDRYVPESVKVLVDNADTTQTLTIQKGVNLVGRLIDADTGEAVTVKDGVVVVCQSAPPVDGSYRETRPDVWSRSYIEDETGIQTGNTGGTLGQRENSLPGRFHLTAVPEGLDYVIGVFSTKGLKTQGAKNYIDRIVAGINVPDGASGDINVGTILLKEGTTITGRLTDADGNPVPGVDVVARPSDTQDWSLEARGTSDAKGYYTLFGIDSEIAFHDLIAASRPWIFDDWGREVLWGEMRRHNVRHDTLAADTGRTAGADFILKPATATLAGTITIPENAEFMLPFSSMGEDYPAAYILLQKKGVTYKQTLEGIEGITEPRPGDEKTARYAVRHIEPGTYRVSFMNRWLPATVVDNVSIGENEATVLNVTWDILAYRISGACTLSGGGYPLSADISGVVCLNTVDRSVIFGHLTQEADGTYTAYEVPGLSGSDTYQLIFYRETGLDDMPEVYPVGSPFTTGDADLAYDAVITRRTEPTLTIRAVRDPDQSGIIRIAVFSTQYLVDNGFSIVTAAPTLAAATGEVYLAQGGGSLGALVFSEDRRGLTMSYIPSETDETIQIDLAVHYGSDAQTWLESFEIDTESVALKTEAVTLYTAQQVTLGNGDATRLYLPAGAVETGAGGNLIVRMAKYETTTGSGLALKASGAALSSVSTPLPDGATAVSDRYELSAIEVGTGNGPSYKNPVVVQIPYQADRVTNTDHLNVYRLTGGKWQMETAARSLDTENGTLSVEVAGLGGFLVAEAEPAPEQPKTETTGTAGPADTSSGDCFIRAARPGANLQGWWMALALAVAWLGLSGIYISCRRGRRRSR